MLARRSVSAIFQRSLPVVVSLFRSTLNNFHPLPGHVHLATMAADAGAGKAAESAPAAPAAFVSITGYATCSYFQKAKAALLGIQVLDPSVTVQVLEHASRDEFRDWWFKRRGDLGTRASAHNSSPAVWLHGNDFLGGCDDTLAWARSNFMAGSAVSKPPRALHANDAVVAGEPAYQYDLVVIGGGSGGLACSKEAAALGARVAVLDFVRPSWAGTTWGLGGTCVNVGCIPKKLMHTAALLGEAAEDAKAFGWELPEARPAHAWPKMVAAVQDHIGSLNWGYRVQLREKGVKYENALGSFLGPHELQLVDKKGKRTAVTARRVVIAVGGRPKPLEIPGGELAISSDDLFSRATSPGKCLVVGASYVALECAGFLAGLGHDVTVMVRSIFLRGFDQQLAEAIGAYMAEHGTKFVRPAVPTRIDRQADGRLLVTFANPDAPAGTAASTDVFDTVFTATGRGADTAGLNLAAAGVAVERDGKLRCVNEQTSVPHIYAIGDVLAGRPELTPVAIMAGRLLARRLFGGATEAMDYERVPTTVFTPLEYGCCGLSEEDAAAKLGDKLEVYHSNYTPLEWMVGEARPRNKCYAKLLVNKADAGRIVGFHVLGPNAGEITQGFATALRLGATYDTFTTTVGIHPTTAEELTTLSVTKSSGGDTAKAGC